MFERFTNRARHVVVLSQEEARLLNHNYIGTEHILLGLLGEPESIGGQVLAGFGLTLDGVRGEVVEKVGRGKKRASGHIPFTPRAKKTLELSLREALSIKHNYIGTEHILLGLIREGEGVAAQILRDHADLLEIRAAVLNAVSATDPGEAGEGAEETNAVLRWLRQRLSRHAGKRPVPPGRARRRASDARHPGGRGRAAAGRAAGRAAARRVAPPAARGARGRELGRLLGARLAWRGHRRAAGKLRAAQVNGTSDEQPEQAGRRQMAIEVSDEMLTSSLTDPVIVRPARRRCARSLAGGRAVAAAAKEAAAADAAGEGAGEEAASEAGRAADQGASVTSTVIRGDLPEAAGLADVWLDLRRPWKSSPARRGAARSGGPEGPPGRVRDRRAARGDQPDEPDEPQAATS